MFFIAFVAATSGLAPQLAQQPYFYEGSPAWIQRPSSTDKVIVFPAEGVTAKTDAFVQLECKVVSSGELEGCVVLKDSPEGFNFGKAAILLSSKFRLNSNLVSQSEKVKIGIAFPLSQRPLGIALLGGPPLSGNEISWAKVLPADKLPMYYPERAQRLEKDGTVVANCGIDGDGSLKECSIVEEHPENFGFGDSFLKIAGQMQVETLTRGGQKTAGRTLQVRFSFKLALDAPLNQPQEAGSPITSPH